MRVVPFEFLISQNQSNKKTAREEKEDWEKRQQFIEDMLFHITRIEYRMNVSEFLSLKLHEVEMHYNVIERLADAAQEDVDRINDNKKGKERNRNSTGVSPHFKN